MLVFNLVFSEFLVMYIPVGTVHCADFNVVTK